jgi:hypothetical protein
MAHTFQIVTTDGRELGPMELGRPDWPVGLPGRRLVGWLVAGPDRQIRRPGRLPSDRSFVLGF